MCLAFSVLGMIALIAPPAFLIPKCTTLLLLLVTTFITTFLGGSKSFALSLDSSSSSTPVRTGQGKVNVLLRVQSNNERWNVDNLLSNSNVSLTDENSGVVNRLGKTRLVDLGLKTSLQEAFNVQGEYVIESE